MVMMYGMFVYLFSLRVNEVDKLLVVLLLNVFVVWWIEFEVVFGFKCKLYYFNMWDKKYNNNVGVIKYDWVQVDVIIINYEFL